MSRDDYSGVVAMAALQMASGASDEEWAAVMKRLKRTSVPGSSEEVVAEVRSVLSEVRRTLDTP